MRYINTKSALIAFGRKSNSRNPLSPASSKFLRLSSRFLRAVCDLSKLGPLFAVQKVFIRLMIAVQLYDPPRRCVLFSSRVAKKKVSSSTVQLAPAEECTVEDKAVDFIQGVDVSEERDGKGKGTVAESAAKYEKERARSVLIHLANKKAKLAYDCSELTYRSHLRQVSECVVKDLSYVLRFCENRREIEFAYLCCHMICYQPLHLIYVHLMMRLMEMVKQRRKGSWKGGIQLREMSNLSRLQLT